MNNLPRVVAQQRPLNCPTCCTPTPPSCDFVDVTVVYCKYCEEYYRGVLYFVFAGSELNGLCTDVVL